MVRVRIVVQCDIRASGPQPVGVLFGVRQGVVIVRRAVMDADRLCDHLRVVDIGRAAIGIDRDVGREVGAGALPELPEALDGGVDRRLSATGEPHQDNAAGVDGGVLFQDFQGAEDIHDQVEPPEQRLIVADAGQATAREAVDGEGRDAHPVEVGHPGLQARSHAAGAVHQDDHGQTPGALGDTEFAGDRHRLAV